MNMHFIRKLEIPMKLKEEFPLDVSLQKIVEKRDEELKSILNGKDNRKILIIGPCSADNEDSVLDYTLKLKKISDKVQNKLFIIPRVFTSKPRTSGDDYKGILHSQTPNGKEDMWHGIIKVRQLHMRILQETKMNAADELLYTQNYKYVDDIIAYVTVGARSVEDQEHKLTASGLSIPVGMKNPTNGDLNVLINSVKTAQNKHMFIYRGWEVESEGNPYAHVVLRGYTNKNGENIENYKYDDLILTNEIYNKFNLQNKAVIIDCNHANSNKNPFEQINVLEDVLESCKKNEAIKKLIKGFMVESYIEDGSQNVTEKVYGKSFTDPCLGLEKTEELIYKLAENI